MPAPIQNDPWLNSRQFGIVIDAGSSGSRLQIYSWKDARTVRETAPAGSLHSLPVVEKGTKDGEDWLVKKEPGISTLGPTPDLVGKYLGPMLEHAKAQIPPSLHSKTPIFLLATAGMRLLPEDQQTSVLAAVCDYMSAHTNFKLDIRGSGSTTGLITNRCGSSIRIISGVEEGLFGWIAVNYLMNGFALDHKDHGKPTTFGFLDMGGASTQMAFEPGHVPEGEEGAITRQSMKDVRLRLLNGEEISHKVFVTTWLGFGTNQARQRYINQAAGDWDSYHSTAPHERAVEHHHAKHSNAPAIPDPCLPKNLIHHESPHHSVTTPNIPAARTFIGTGSFSQCLAQTAPLLNKSAHCAQAPCLFDGVHVPPIDFSFQRFIGVSEYWYSSQHIFGLGGAFDFEQYEQAAQAFCGREWDDIMKQHKEASSPSASPSTWGKQVDQSRLEMQCFKAAWIVNVLGKGFGMPRKPKDWDAPAPNLQVEEKKASELGLDKGDISNPIFQSLDSVSGTSVSWTLGKMVLEASKGVPPASVSSPDIADPIVDHRLETSTAATSTSGGRLTFLDLDSIEDRLPSPLRREALGFSPILPFIYLATICVCLFAFLRFRHRFRSSFRRWRRASVKRDREKDSFINEDGMSTYSSSSAFDSPPLSPTHPPSAPALAALSRLGSSIRRFVFQSSPLRPAGMSPMSSSPPYAYSRVPIRQNSGPPSVPSSPRPYQTTFLKVNGAPLKISTGAPDDAGFYPGTPSPGLGLSPSRNSSQINLTTLLPRGTSTSRSVSGVQTPLASGYRTPKVADFEA